MHTASVPRQLLAARQLFPVNHVMEFRGNCARLSVLIKICTASFGPPPILFKNCPTSYIVDFVLLAGVCLREWLDPGTLASVNLEMYHALITFRSAVIKPQV